MGVRDSCCSYIPEWVSYCSYISVIKFNTSALPRHYWLNIRLVSETDCVVCCILTIWFELIKIIALSGVQYWRKAVYD